MSYLELFLEFLKIGFIMFGGGYGGIGILYKVLVEEKKWLSPDEFLSIIGIAESTPGPIAINAATWIGYKLCGVIGSIIATLGVVLPAYIVIVLVATIIMPYMNHYIARAVFRGINAAVLAIILYAFVMLLKGSVVKQGYIDFAILVIFITMFLLLLLTKVNPVVIIILSALVSTVMKLVFSV